MKFTIVMLFICLFSLVACSKPPITVEEKVLGEAFTIMAHSQAYDQFCNEGRITKATEIKPANANWYGNQQILSYFMAAPFKKRYPKAKVEEAAKYFADKYSVFEAQAKGVLREKGCDSAEGEQLKISLDMLTSLMPHEFAMMIKNRVEKMGGVLTTNFSPEAKK